MLEMIGLQVAGILVGLVACACLNKIRFGFWLPKIRDDHQS